LFLTRAGPSLFSNKPGAKRLIGQAVMGKGGQVSTIDKAEHVMAQDEGKTGTQN